MPLAAALHSALQNAASVELAQIVVASTDLRPRSQQKLRRIVDRAPVEASIRFVEPDVSLISAFPTTNWHKLPVYLRLLIDEIVPPDWKRAIFLDGDVVVRGDLGKLWRLAFNGNVAMGVQDFRNPTVAHRHSLRKAYLQDLGLPAETVYCNAGLMVIDLAAWREERVGPRCIEFLNAYGDDAEYKDQDAINGVLGGRWEVVAPTWNVALSALQYDGYPDHESSESQKAQARLCREPQVIHFSGPSKPWHHMYRRPLSSAFFDPLLASEWFSPEESRRWIGTRRLAHGALNLVPASLVRGAKDVVDRLRAQ